MGPKFDMLLFGKPKPSPPTDEVSETFEAPGALDPEFDLKDAEFPEPPVPLKALEALEVPETP